jgi:hypothetical protein
MCACSWQLPRVANYAEVTVEQSEASDLPIGFCACTAAVTAASASAAVAAGTRGVGARDTCCTPCAELYKTVDQQEGCPQLQCSTSIHPAARAAAP